MDLREEGVIELLFAELIFRVWACCLVTSVCASAATVLILALTVGNVKAKKKARLVEEDGPEDVL